ncbi:MAG: hypothetical protein LBT20_04900 [Clostridiales bacterium]|jgi:hypothetical protein|nr:hypothetical protein [Clostridiales bacterium]
MGEFCGFTVYMDVNNYVLVYPDFHIIVTSNLHKRISKESEVRSCSYGANTNTTFTIFDHISNIIGQAAGIGKTEREALEMCVSKINQYLNDPYNSEKNRNIILMQEYKEFSYDDLKLINMGKRITVSWYSNNGEANAAFIYFKETESDGIKSYRYVSSVERKVQFSLSTDDIINKTIEKINPEKRYKRISRDELLAKGIFPIGDMFYY